MNRRTILAGSAVALLTVAGAAGALAQSPAAPSALPDVSPIASMAAPDASAGTADLPHPAHIHDGLCPEPGDAVQPLSDLVVGTDAAVGAASAMPVEISTSVVQMSLADIVGADRSINVHESMDAMDQYIACGDLGGSMLGERSLAIGLVEQNGSGHNGVAYLQDNGDGTTNVQVFLMKAGVSQPTEGPGASAMPMPSAVAEPSTVPAESMAPVPSAAPLASPGTSPAA